MEFVKFPARVTYNDGTVLDPAAVVVHGAVARIARRMPDRSAEEQPDLGTVATVDRLPNRDTLIGFTDGGTVTVGKGKGCSCGSPLKSWYSAAVVAAQ